MPANFLEKAVNFFSDINVREESRSGDAVKENTSVTQSIVVIEQIAKDPLASGGMFTTKQQAFADRVVIIQNELSTLSHQLKHGWDQLAVAKDRLLLGVYDEVCSIIKAANQALDATLYFTHIVSNSPEHGYQDVALVGLCEEIKCSLDVYAPQLQNPMLLVKIETIKLSQALARQSKMNEGKVKAVFFKIGMLVLKLADAADTHFYQKYKGDIFTILQAIADTHEFLKDEPSRIAKANMQLAQHPMQKGYQALTEEEQLSRESLANLAADVHVLTRSVASNPDTPADRIQAILTSYREGQRWYDFMSCYQRHPSRVDQLSVLSRLSEGCDDVSEVQYRGTLVLIKESIEQEPRWQGSQLRQQVDLALAASGGVELGDEAAARKMLESIFAGSELSWLKEKVDGVEQQLG